jgi:hypothetical protein
MPENNLDEQSSQDSNAKLWLGQTTLKTSWHVARVSGLHAWERFLATSPALTARELHSIRQLAILFDRNPVPFEFYTAEAISACLEVLISRAGLTEEIIVPSPAQVREWLALLGLSLAKQPMISLGPDGIPVFNADAARAYGLPPDPVPPWQEPKIVQSQSGPQPQLDPACQPGPIEWVTLVEKKVSDACTEYTFQLSTGGQPSFRKWHSPVNHQQKREIAEAEQFLSSIHDPESQPLSAKERARRRQNTRQLGRQLRGEAERRDADRRKDSK